MADWPTQENKFMLNDECTYRKDQEDGFLGYCLHPEPVSPVF